MLMKFLFKVLVLPILTLIAIPAIILAFLYKPVEIPKDDFSSIQAVSLTAMIQENIDEFLVDNDQDSTVGIELAQSDANSLLLNQLRSINPDYMVDSATDDKKYYVMKESFFGYQGSWVRFKDDVIEIESGAHIFVSSFTFKTRLLIAFKITIDTDEVVLKLDKLTVGNIPLAWSFSTASWIAEQVTGDSLKSLIDGQLKGLATFDLTKREIRLSVDTIIEEMIQENQQKAMIRSLIAFVKANDFLDIGFNDGSFGVDLALGKLHDPESPFVLNEADKIANDTQLQSILASKASAMIFSTLGSTNPTPFIDLDALTLNRMFEYFMRGNQTTAGSGIILETPLFEKYLIKAYVPYISFAAGNKFIVNIPLVITDDTDPLKHFQSIIKIDATPEISGSDLRIVLNELNAGTVSLTNQYIADILTMLGDNDIIVDGAFVIKDFDTQMNAAGMGIQSVAVVNERLRIFVSLSESIPIAQIQDAVQDVLDAIQNNPAYPPELTDAVSDVLASLTDPEADPQQAIEALVTEFGNLSDSDQALLFDDLVDALEDTGLTYEEIFGLLG